MRSFTVIVLFALATLMAFSQTREPWNEYSRLTFLTSGSASGDRVSRILAPAGSIDEFEQRYGQVPNYFARSLNDSIQFYMRLYYLPYAGSNDASGNPDLRAWWQEQLTWGQVRPHLIGILENTATAVRDTFPLPPGDPNYDVLLNSRYTQFASDSGSYAYQDSVRLGDIPATITPDVLYRAWIEPVGDELPDSRMISIDTLTFVLADRSTPGDTLLWVYQNWDDVQENNPDLFHRLHYHYPTDTRLLSVLFWLSYYEVNCDSVTYFGNELIDVWQSGQSTYLGDAVSTFDIKEGIQDVQDRIEDICVDGTPQPYSRLGGSQW